MIADLSTKKEDLERAAELAVERAAEKAAERAVEKALNSGNSSTITVTVKEAYSNSKKTAEEAAAPGSESTRPYDSKIYDRQYGYTPPGSYKVDDSSEAKELGIPKEALNSSVENLESAEATSAEETDRSVESTDGPEADASFESAKDVSDKSVPVITAVPGSINNFDSSTALGFGADFSGLDASADSSFKGDFGLKSDTKTFSTSYSNTKDDFPGTKVDVDDEEDAEIFKMYASDFGDGGWSSTKKEGWVRHRQLWDDNKNPKTSQNFGEFDDFGDISTGETQATGEKVAPDDRNQTLATNYSSNPHTSHNNPHPYSNKNPYPHPNHNYDAHPNRSSHFPTNHTPHIYSNSNTQSQPNRSIIPHLHINYNTSPRPHQHMSPLPPNSNLNQNRSLNPNIQLNPKVKLHKRMVEKETETTDHITGSFATLSLDTKTPTALFDLLQQEVKLPISANQYDNRSPVPMKVYITIPVPYVPAYGFHKKNYETKAIDLTVPPKQFNDEVSYFS